MRERAACLRPRQPPGDQFGPIDALAARRTVHHVDAGCRFSAWLVLSLSLLVGAVFAMSGPMGVARSNRVMIVFEHERAAFELALGQLAFMFLLIVPLLGAW